MDLKVQSDLTGSVWKIEVDKGDVVSEGDVLALLESMKMEIPVTAPEDGVVKEIKINEGDVVSEGDTIVILQV